ncbi:MAG TPA: carboxypeptidase regulatory-like domain-containing protein, partial [Candidatus Eisenbacteria bacterium]|nr:carboxypeptidase regulatory-like domain-containing protein [Candidatus Eisenbacteria bacterium]
MKTSSYSLSTGLAASLLMLVLVGGPAVASAETAGSLISGRILDASNGEPLSGVLVRVHSAGVEFRAVSGADGSFDVVGTGPDGPFVVEVARVGYRPYRREFPAIVETNIRLEPEIL